MRPPRSPRRERSREIRTPELQVVASGPAPESAGTAPPTIAPLTRLGNRASERFLARLRDRAAAARAPVAPDPEPRIDPSQERPAEAATPPATEPGTDTEPETEPDTGPDTEPEPEAIAETVATAVPDPPSADAATPREPASEPMPEDAGLEAAPETDAEPPATPTATEPANGLTSPEGDAPLADADLATVAPETAAPPMPEGTTETASDTLGPAAVQGGGGGAAAAPDAEPLRPGPELAAWHRRTVGAAAAIETPDQPRAAAAAPTLRGHATRLRSSRAARRDSIGTEAAAAIPEPPQPVDPPPAPPPDPVPEANQRVEDTADQRLDTVTLPDLVVSPRGTQPLVQDPAARSPPPDPETTDQTSTDQASSEPADPTSEDAMSVETVTEAASMPAPELPPGTAEGVSIEDTPPPPREPLPPGVNNVMRQVIARLLLNPQEQARPIITEARNEAYPNRVLPRAFNTIGEDKLSDLTGDLTRALNLVAADAGIAADELQSEVDARRAEAAAAADTATTELDAAETDEAEALSDASGEELGEVAAAEDGERARATATVAAATGEGSPQVIDSRRDAQIRKINRRVADIRFDYDRAKDRRHAALDRARALQDRAYDQTRTADIAEVSAEHTAPEDSITRMLAIGRVSNWADASKRTLATRVTTLKTEATTQANGFRSATATAGDSATEQVRTWASSLKGETTSWWDELWAMFTDWSQQAETEAENWSEVRAGEARDATVANMSTLAGFMQTEGEAVNLETNAAFQVLSAEQQAVVQAYYASPPGNRDTIGAVAAGLRFRLASQQKPLVAEAMKTEVMAKPAAEWPQLEQIGAAQRSGFSAETICSEIYDAMFGGVTGWGTDEDKIYNSLSGMTPLQGKAVRACYSATYRRNLDSDLASELDEDNALVRARAALDGDPVIEAVGALNEAMSGLGTDEDTIMRMLRGKSAEQRAAITEEYRRRYGVDLDAALDSEMDDHDQERAEALLAGDTSRADAIALDQAMHGGILGWGTDEAQIESVYGDIRGDVAGEMVPDGQGGQRRMTQAEMEAEVLRRNAQVEQSYDDRYGTPGDQDSALRAAYADELSGPDLDLANALADNDLVAADAARLERERRGVYTDDTVVNGILENQYGRALDAIERDPEWAEQQRLLNERQFDSPYERAAAERDLRRRMEDAARAGGAANMAALEDRYDSSYSRWGSGGLQVMIAFNMSGTDQEKARTLLEQGGYLTRAQRFDYATRGLGTDEAEARRALTGATAAEIAEIDRTRAAAGQPSVVATIDDEMDGRDRFDTRMLAEGVPENADQEMDQSRRRARWEINNSPVGGVQRDVLEQRLARMEAQHALINDPDADPFERQRALDQFRSRAQGVQAGVDSYRRQVDAVTDAVATVAALTAAITVTVLTGGVAGAVLGALYAAVTTMLVKSTLKGAAYGADEMAVDAVVGIVDAAMAYATFGMGNALLRVATSQGGRVSRMHGTRMAATLARMAGSASRTQRMLAHGVAESVEGATGALPSALAGNVLNDQNWERGNPLTNILGGTLMETGMGAVMSGGMGSFGGVSMPGVDPPTPRSGDILAHRGTPQDRLDAWRQHRADNPDANMGDFLRRYDAQVSERLAAEATDAGVQRALRTELYAGIPPRQRRLFKDVEIEVMSDADFRAFTRSDSGNAVTIIDNGRPRIILRDGAPPHVLREEGLHLQQIMDPELGPLVRRLDETRLRDWDSLSIGEQMELYSLKVELEIDAQIRLIDGLDADIRAAHPGTDLDALARQRAVAQDSLNNLRRRADEVAREGPLERIAMARGLRDPPPYLDQPARLFSKDGKGKLLPVVKDRSGSIRVDGTDIHGTFSTRGSSKVLQAPEGGTVRFEVELPDGTVHEFGLDGNQLRRRQIDPSNGPWMDVERGTVVQGNLRYTEIHAGVSTPRTEPMTFEVTGKREIYINREYFTPHAEPPIGMRVAPDERARSYSDDALKPLGWRPSGGSINRKGDIAELASSLRSQGNVADATSPVLASLSVQRPGKKGFDGVELVIDANGVPFLRIIEVKNYATHVPFADITAVTRSAGTGDNLQANLLDLETRTRPTLDELDEARRRLDTEAAADADYGEPIGQGWFGGRADDGGMGLEDWYDMAAGGDSMAERALADQAAQQADISDMADRIVAERLGISLENLHLIREALGNLRTRQNFELEFRLAGGAELGGDVARTATGAPQPHTTRARVEADWQGTGRVLPTETLSDAEYAAAEAIHDAATGTSGFHSHIQATGRPDVQFVDADGNMLALQRPNQSACQNPEGIAADIAARLRTSTRIPPNDAGLPFVALDLSDSIGDKAALKTQIEAALNDIDPPLTTDERIRLIYLNDPV